MKTILFCMLHISFDHRTARYNSTLPRAGHAARQRAIRRRAGLTNSRISGPAGLTNLGTSVSLVWPISIPACIDGLPSRAARVPPRTPLRRIRPRSRAVAAPRR